MKHRDWWEINKLSVRPSCHQTGSPGPHWRFTVQGRVGCLSKWMEKPQIPCGFAPTAGRILRSALEILLWEKWTFASVWCKDITSTLSIDSQWWNASKYKCEILVLCLSTFFLCHLLLYYYYYTTYQKETLYFLLLTFIWQLLYKLRFLNMKHVKTCKEWCWWCSLISPIV